MDVKPGAEIENPESSSPTVNYRREGSINETALHKTSQKKGANRYTSKQRNLSACEALRDWAGEHEVNHYSIYSLSEALFNLGFNNLTEWRYATKVKTMFYQLTLRQLELEDEQSNKPDIDKLRLMPFTFNLSTKIQNQMVKSKRREMTTCLDKLNKTLTASLGRRVDMWFQYEMAPKANKGKPHIQGAMLLSNSEEIKVAKAFHKVNGQVDTLFKRFAFRFGGKKRDEIAEINGQLFADLNWASYCAKETARTLLTFVDQNHNDWGKVVACSSGLNRRTKEIYRELRGLLKNQTQDQHLH